MQKLISELKRLYLPQPLPQTGAAPELLEALDRQLLGRPAPRLALGAGGAVRAVALPFARSREMEEGAHWTRLCEVANALQQELGLPAPAVSISGDHAFALWLSFEEALPAVEVQRFLELLRARRFPDFTLAPDAATATVTLPPCLNPATGKWAAFIHPGMGAAFADEAGLELAPPLAGQAAFLEPLESITTAQFRQALERLQPPAPRPDPIPDPAPPAPPAPARNPDTLLLKDATLEDIVRHLHALNIEPTFRHLLERQD